MSELDAPIQAMFDATNAGDSDAFVAAFADDAVLIDWGREFGGHAEIARWNANENRRREDHPHADPRLRPVTRSVRLGRPLVRPAADHPLGMMSRTGADACIGA